MNEAINFLSNMRRWEYSLPSPEYYNIQTFAHNRKDTIGYIPGVKTIEPGDLTSYLQETDVSTVVHGLIFEGFKDVKRADFILYNTVEDRGVNWPGSAKVPRRFGPNRDCWA
ncbi:hypothetical protein L484_024350 [Morus notabilis]|uniref:Uncharacterized protein n=1 Tax=Morus notabilis TaxID=981085 RepID=W9SLF6_9ROSA|nr:hypothetical protein L484_024350 [Morus notabilis]